MVPLILSFEVAAFLVSLVCLLIIIVTLLVSPAATVLFLLLATVGFFAILLHTCLTW